MEIVGRQIEFGVATEATRGTAESTVDRWMRKVTANVVERAAHAADDTTRGVLEDGEGRRVVQKYVEGDIDGILHADMAGYFFSNIYGKVTTTTISGSVKQHVFELRQNIQHQSLTLFAKDGSVQQYAYSNAMINTFELTVALDDYVRFSSNFVASVASANSATPDYDVEYDFVARDVTVKIADTEGGLSSGTVLKAKDFTLSWDQGVIRDHVVGSYNPDDNYNARLLIEGSIRLNFTNEQMKNLYLGNGAKYMQITIEGEADLGGGNKPKLDILLNKVQFMDWNREGDANDLVTEPLNFQAFYNGEDDQASKVTLQNLTVSYANVPSN